MKTVLLPYSDYIKFLYNHSLVIDSLSNSFKSNRDFKTLFKTIHLDVDSIIPLLKPFYTNNGRPTKNQIQILEFFILMSHYRCVSIFKWVNEVKNNDLYAFLCGFDTDDVPSVASYYDFINRFYAGKEAPHVLPTGHFTNKYSNKDIPKKGEKLENYNILITRTILESYNDSYVDDFPKDNFFKFFQILGVNASIKNVLIDTSKPSIISSDGTAFATSSNIYGHRINGDNERRHYSNVDANQG